MGLSLDYQRLVYSLENSQAYKCEVLKKYTRWTTCWPFLSPLGHMAGEAPATVVQLENEDYSTDKAKMETKVEISPKRQELEA